MSADIILYGVGIFLATLILHILIWRFKHPKRHFVALGVIFWFIPLGLFLIYQAMGGNVDLEKTFAIGFLHFSLTCAYIQSYPAIHDLSPSLLIMPVAAQAGEKGVTLEEIQKRLDTPLFLEERIQFLLAAGLLTDVGGRLHLTMRSKILVNLFIAMRRGLGMPLGMG